MPRERNNYSRRELLAGATAVCVSTLIIDTAFADDQMKIKTAEAQSLLAELVDGRVSRTLSRTALEALGVHTGKFFLIASLEKLGIKVDNYAKGSRGELYRKVKELDPKTLFEVLVSKPVSEELLMRFLPSLLVGDRGKLRLDIGIPASLGFALMHNLQTDEYNRTVVDTSFIPLSQFLSGLYYWYLQREFGTLHPILAHTVNNSLASAFIIAGLKDKEIYNSNHEQN